MRENIVITRGDSKDIERTLLEGGLPMSLVGSLITFTVDGLFTKTLDNGIELEPPDSGTDPGVITISIDPEDTADVPAYRSVYRYDVQVDDGGIVTTPLLGDFIVTPDVTP
jgi:hypothetical protein